METFGLLVRDGSLNRSIYEIGDASPYNNSSNSKAGLSLEHEPNEPCSFTIMNFDNAKYKLKLRMAQWKDNVSLSKAIEQTIVLLPGRSSHIDIPLLSLIQCIESSLHSSSVPSVGSQESQYSNIYVKGLHCELITSEEEREEQLYCKCILTPSILVKARQVYLKEKETEKDGHSGNKDDNENQFMSNGNIPHHHMNGPKAVVHTREPTRPILGSFSTSTAPPLPLPLSVNDDEEGEEAEVDGAITRALNSSGNDILHLKHNKDAITTLEQSRRVWNTTNGNQGQQNDVGYAHDDDDSDDGEDGWLTEQRSPERTKLRIEAVQRAQYHHQYELEQQQFKKNTHSNNNGNTDMANVNPCGHKMARKQQTVTSPSSLNMSSSKGHAVSIDPEVHTEPVQCVINGTFDSSLYTVYVR